MKSFKLIIGILAFTVTFTSGISLYASGKNATLEAGRKSAEARESLGIAGAKQSAKKVEVKISGQSPQSVLVEEPLQCIAPGVAAAGLDGPVAGVDALFAAAGLPSAVLTMDNAARESLKGLVPDAVFAEAEGKNGNAQLKAGLAKLSLISRAAIEKAIAKFGSYSTKIKSHIAFVWNEIRTTVNAEIPGHGDALAESCAI